MLRQFKKTALIRITKGEGLGSALFSLLKTWYLTLDFVYTGRVMSEGWEISWIFWSVWLILPPSPHLPLTVSFLGENKLVFSNWVISVLNLYKHCFITQVSAENLFVNFKDICVYFYKYWKGVISSKFCNINFIHLCPLQNLIKKIIIRYCSIQGEIIAEESFSLVL